MELFQIIGIVIVICLLTFLAVVFIYGFFIPFTNERRYLILELNRARDEEEFEYWKHQLRVFYIKQIPVIGVFLSKRYK